MIDGDWSSPDDKARERAEREAAPQRQAAEAAARDFTAAAQSQLEADAAAKEMARLSQQMRAAYPGTDEMWEQDKAAILSAERGRLTARQDAAARQAQRSQYQ